MDQTRARRAGVTSSDIAGALSGVYSGVTISDYREGDRVIPIVFRGDDETRFSLSSLQSMQFYASSTGEFVSLEQVAGVGGGWRFGRIIRRNQSGP